MPDRHEQNQNIRVGRAYSAHELVEQKYRELGFWSRVLSVALIVLGAFTLVTGGAAFGLFVIGGLAKVGVEIGRAYFRSVYRVG